MGLYPPPPNSLQGWVIPLFYFFFKCLTFRGDICLQRTFTILFFLPLSILFSLFSHSLSLSFHLLSHFPFSFFQTYLYTKILDFFTCFTVKSFRWLWHSPEPQQYQLNLRPKNSTGTEKAETKKFKTGHFQFKVRKWDSRYNLVTVELVLFPYHLIYLRRHLQSNKKGWQENFIYQNKEYTFVVVHGLKSFDGADGFAELLEGRKLKLKRPFFAISSDNYQIVQIHKNLNEYKTLKQL